MNNTYIKKNPSIRFDGLSTGSINCGFYPELKLKSFVAKDRMCTHDECEQSECIEPSTPLAPTALLALFVFSILACNLFSIADAQPKRVLIGSPVHQKPAILKEFLDSLARLERNEIKIDYFFVDDNESVESTNVLIDFAKQQTQSCCMIFKNPRKQEAYHCNETTHYWSHELIWKVASFKDKMIQRALNDGYDYLFLIDSDIVMNPRTVECLVNTQKDIISEIFWTQWLPEQPELPQVWVSDIYNLYEKGEREQLSQEQIYQRQTEFLTKLRVPGIYEIGGLGACTLISKKALQAGVNFKKIKNITFWGEDRHFCIRASALGLPLFVDTHYPAYHIYRESALEGVHNFIIANS